MKSHHIQAFRWKSTHNSRIFFWVQRKHSSEV
jgi:hypothetical protein